MEAVADIAERYAFDEIRVSHEQNLILPHVARADLKAVYDALVEIGLATANAGLITDIIACPGPRLLRARQCPLDPGRAAASRALRLAGAAARHRRAEDQDLRLHQCLRPSPCRPYRHPRRREEGRRALPDHARRLGRRAHLDRRDHRPRLRPGRDHRRDRDDRRDLSRRCALDRDEKFLDAYRRVGAAPFKEALYGGRSQSRLTPSAEPPTEAAQLDAPLRPSDARTRSSSGAADAAISPASIAAVSSFGADSAVLLHMIAEVDRNLPVIFLDTGKHFGETLDYRDALAADLGLTDVRIVDPLAEALLSRRSRRQSAHAATPTAAARSARSSRWHARSSRSAPG